jgi:N-acetyl sugar amidotransferase
LDDDGICSGCRIHEEKDRLDWGKREEELSRLLMRYKSASASFYDCVIPVSGARDSYFIVDTIKNRYGLNPLLVHYNCHYNTNRGHRNLSYLRTQFDCDFYSQVLSPDTVKRLTRRTLEKRASLYWHCLAGQTVLPVHVAVRYKIPLIIWGAHQGIDQVGMYSHLDDVEMSRKYRKDHDLMGLEAEDLVSGADGLPEKDLLPFFYPHDKDIERVGVRGIYLNNFIRWDTKAQHEKMIRCYSYETAAQTRTFDTYSDVDSFIYSDLHDYVKFLKFGYSKVTDHATREIRLRRMTRSQGIELVRQYTEKPPTETNLFLKWLGISERDLIETIDKFRDPAIWSRNDGGDWQLEDRVDRHPHGDEHRRAELDLQEGKCAFEISKSRKPTYVEDRYVLIARGHVNQ